MYKFDLKQQIIEITSVIEAVKVEFWDQQMMWGSSKIKESVLEGLSSDRMNVKINVLFSIKLLGKEVKTVMIHAAQSWTSWDLWRYLENRITIINTGSNRAVWGWRGEVFEERFKQRLMIPHRWSLQTDPHYSHVLLKIMCFSHHIWFYRSLMKVQQWADGKLHVLVQIRTPTWMVHSTL